MNEVDVERVKKSMEKNGRSCSIAMTLGFDYIAFHVKITVPSIKKSDCVLKAILQRGYSNPTGPFCGLYCQKIDAYG